MRVHIPNTEPLLYMQAAPAKSVKTQVVSSHFSEDRGGGGRVTEASIMPPSQSACLGLGLSATGTRLLKGHRPSSNPGL